ncbi:GGDEF domain-containing protein [Leucothrix arctica]|nr:GGDEF domain-containing protein [Leucothrix arctica]
MSSTAMLLITALLLIIRKMPSRDGINCWLFAAFLQAVIYVIAFISYPAPMTVAATVAFYCMEIMVTLSLTIGTLKFIGKPINRDFRLAIATGMIVVISVLASNDSQFLASLVFACYLSAAHLEVGLRFYKSEEQNLKIKTSMVLFFIASLHWFDFPFLSRIEWFAPIGFMIGMVIAVAIYLSLSVLALHQFKFNTEESEKKAIHAAIHDPLTGLYNRSYLDRLFEEYAEEAELIQRPFILLYFDLDGFKYVNDTYGHPAGDLILTTVSKRMSKWLGAKGDAIRVGGDELIVLTRLRANFSRKNGLAAAQRILNLIEQPIVDGDHNYKVSASVGGCCYGLPHCNLEDMIIEADKLMYQAKQSGGHCIHFSRFEADTLIAQSKQSNELESAVLTSEDKAQR